VIYVSVVETEAGVNTEGPKFADQPTGVIASWEADTGSTLWIVAHEAPLTKENIAVLVNALHFSASDSSQPYCNERAMQQLSHAWEVCVIDLCWGKD